MLSRIQIRDFAIIDAIELELASAMTALTGETGAGKSILVDALLFVLGGRSGTDVIRHGCDKTEVTATFLVNNNTAVSDWFREQDLDLDDECILRRSLGSDGRSRAWVNGQSMPVQALRTLGEALVDVHGQMEYQSLMKRSAQRGLLDQHGQHAALLDKVAASYRQLSTLRNEREQIARSAADRNERLELLRYHVTELTALAPEAGELANLGLERQRHTHSGKLAQGARELIQLLRDADGANAELALSRATHVIRQLAQVDTRLNDTAKVLDEALIACREAVNNIEHYESSLDADPARQEWVENRLAALESAARKHRVEADALPELLQTQQAEITQLESLEFTLEQLDAQLQVAQSDFVRQCAALTKARNAAAKSLSERITTLMQSLGMPGGKFAVELHALEIADANAQGAEDIEFMVSANPGQPLKPLAKVASGGELSRISLSVQVAAVESIPVPTLVFDEVDSGVGGAVAEMVGRQLSSLGQHAQVLCVTHLPQVAAQAQQQVRVAKLTDGKHTRTMLETLSADARVEEIARMLGGTQISDMARSHAREMLGSSVIKPAAKKAAKRR